MEKTPSLYINLIIEDLPASIEFYKTLGFVQNFDFSNDDAAALAWKDEFVVMLLTKNFTKTFLPERKTFAEKNMTTALYAIGFCSREEVDTWYTTALRAGAKMTQEYDHGFMYGRDFEDLDGHIWEAFWMDPAGMPKE